MNTATRRQSGRPWASASGTASANSRSVRASANRRSVLAPANSRSLLVPASSAWLTALGLGLGAWAGGSAKADVIHVDPSWMQDGSPVLINNILDNDPTTFGKNGQIDAQPGDIVFFDEGTYQLGLIPQQHDYYKFILRVPNVIIDGAGSDRVILRGNDTSGGFIWDVFVDGVELKNFRTENSQWGILFRDSIDLHNVSVRWLEMRAHVKHILYPKQEDNQETTTPAVIVENVYFRNPPWSNCGEGIHVNGQPNHATPNTKYAGLSNCTLDGLAIGTSAPYYIYVDENGNLIVVVKGVNDFHDNFAMNGAWTYDENLYPGFHTPDGHVEANNTEPSLYALGIQPQPPLTQNLEYTIAQLRLDSQGRPLWDSPLVGLQYRLGYCGARPPARTPGDLNCDGRVDFADIDPFVLALSSPDSYHAVFPDCNILNGDCNGDGAVDFADIDAFVALLSG